MIRCWERKAMKYSIQLLYHQPDSFAFLLFLFFGISVQTATLYHIFHQYLMVAFVDIGFHIIDGVLSTF